MTMSFDLALKIAADAHAGQKDKGGHSYIRHPMTVALDVANFGEDYMVVAILHDVVEDTHWSLEMLSSLGLTEYQLDALDRLTKKVGEQRRDNYIRCNGNLISKAVKTADTKHNLDLRRIKNKENLQPKDLERINDYIWGYTFLTGG